MTQKKQQSQADSKNATLQMIFEKMGDKEWDWFECEENKIAIDGNRITLKHLNLSEVYSLPDLLANRSLCIAWWGNKKTGAIACATNGKPPKEIYEYMMNRAITFEKFCDEGEQQALNYIYRTML